MIIKNHLRSIVFFFFWIAHCAPVSGQITIIIASLPEATPPEDTIFVSGTFNNWSVNDVKYILKKQVNGTLMTTIPMRSDMVEYKFTRGSWVKVETGRENEYVPNRLFELGDSSTVYVRIENWQDLGGAKNVPYMAFFYFAIAFQGLLLISLAHRILKPDPIKLTQFTVFNSMIVTLILGMVIYHLVNPIWQTYVSLGAQVLIFVWGPVFYLFIRSFFVSTPSKNIYFHFIPAGLVIVFSVMRLFNMASLSFLYDFWKGSLTWGNLLVVGSGSLVVFGYGISAFVRIRSNRDQMNLKDPAFNFSQLLVIVNLGIVLITGARLILDYAMISMDIIGDFNFTFLAISTMLMIETYFVWKYPQVLRERVELLKSGEVEMILKRLKDLMEFEKVYIDAELNIQQLSTMLNTKSYVLSKILNEHYQKNFRDFVNGYRVEEFIRLADSGKLATLTFLGLAYEVGFNSKSTFNLAFKKFTDKNPRDYFKTS